MITRTDYGLANEHLFREVEYVVYCEGKAIEGEGNSLDEAFWTKVFSCNGINVRCKSQGSKTDLRKFAQKVIEKSIPNVLVAMDRDYDHLQNLLIIHKKVFYTYGYSWENDVIAQLNFPVAFSAFATTAEPEPIQREYEEFYSEQSKFLKRIFALDFKYIAHKGRLFDRGSPMSIIVHGDATVPSINRRLLIENASKFGRFQTDSLPATTYRSACGVCNFHGKTVAKLFYHWFVFRANKFERNYNIYYDSFMASQIANINMGSSTPRDIYYADAISAIQ